MLRAVLAASFALTFASCLSTTVYPARAANHPIEFYVDDSAERMPQRVFSGITHTIDTMPPHHRCFDGHTTWQTVTGSYDDPHEVIRKAEARTRELGGDIVRTYTFEQSETPEGVVYRLEFRALRRW